MFLGMTYEFIWNSESLWGSTPLLRSSAFFFWSFPLSFRFLGDFPPPSPLLIFFFFFISICQVDFLPPLYPFKFADFFEPPTVPIVEFLFFFGCFESVRGIIKTTIKVKGEPKKRKEKKEKKKEKRAKEKRNHFSDREKRKEKKNKGKNDPYCNRFFNC